MLLTYNLIYKLSPQKRILQKFHSMYVRYIVSRNLRNDVLANSLNEKKEEKS